jgi:hypothetical protein
VREDAQEHPPTRVVDAGCPGWAPAISSDVPAHPAGFVKLLRPRLVGGERPHLRRRRWAGCRSRQ